MSKHRPTNRIIEEFRALDEPRYPLSASLGAVYGIESHQWDIVGFQRLEVGPAFRLGDDAELYYVALQEAAERWVTDIADVRLVSIEQEMSDIRLDIQVLGEARSFIVPIQALDPGPVQLIKPFDAVIEPAGDEYTAAFYDANIHASGETVGEAIRNLKSTIISIFTRFSRESRLGPEPTRQLAVLRQFIALT
jgi:predicted RNase H-like HicB family nuclease